MQTAAAVSILAMTVGLSLRRPRFGSLTIQPPVAALLGAGLMLALRLVSVPESLDIVRLLAAPVATLVSLMAMTLVAERAGVFRLLASRVATAANGDGRRLFAALFLAGTATGALFTNDAAILIFTPLVVGLVEEVAEPSWSTANKLPFYVAVLYVANLVGPFVISNPINLIVASLFGIGFLEYAAWMFLPAVASIVISFLGLRWVFRHTIPAQYRIPTRTPLPAERRGLLLGIGLVLALTLVGLMTSSWTGVPAWLVALLGAGVLLVMATVPNREPMMPIVRGIGWDVVVFVLGIFVVATGLRNAGATEPLGGLLIDPAAPNIGLATVTTGFVAAISSAIMNNHPTASMMALTIADLGLAPDDSRMLAYAALIGGDLGPKMLPIGSLAALLWFRLLRQRGIAVSYGLYIRIGFPITLAAVALSLLVLNLERLLVANLS